MKFGVFWLAARDLRGKPIRTLLLLLSVSAVTGTLFGATVFLMGMQNALEVGANRLGADVLVVPEDYEPQARTALLSGEPAAFYMEGGVLDKVRGVEGVRRASPQLFVKPSPFKCCYGVDVFLLGFDPETDFTVRPWLEGHIDRPLMTDELIVGRDLEAAAGDTVPFFGSSFRVAGVMEPTGMNFFDRSVFMTMEGAYRMAERSKERAMQELDISRGQISAVLVQAAKDAVPGRVAIRIESEVEGVKAIVAEQVISTVRKQLQAILKGIVFMGGALWVVVLLLVGFTFYMSVNERRREIGLLRAMGAKKSQVFKLIIYEASIVSAAGGVFGALTAGFLLLMFEDMVKHGFKLPYLIPGAGALSVIFALAIVFAELTGLAAALVPAVSAGRMEPYDAIRKGE